MLFKIRRKVAGVFLLCAFFLINVTLSFAGTTNYDYDAVNRLVGVVYEEGELVKYEYDEIGNLKKKVIGDTIVKVAKTGLGDGEVVVSPEGASCGEGCYIYTSDTDITLAAAADEFSKFDGWSGACADAGICALTVTGVMNVSAAFSLSDGIPLLSAAPESYNFGSVVGLGLSDEHSFVISNPGSGDLVIEQDGVSLTGVDAEHFVITDDGCSGKTLAPIEGACTVKAWFKPLSAGAKDAEISITSNYPYALTKVIPIYGKAEGTEYTLEVAKIGVGTVTSSVGGIVCGVDCEKRFFRGLTLTLTAEKFEGYDFIGWSGLAGAGCSGTGDCTITMNSNLTVTAVFAKLANPLDLIFVIDTSGSMWDDIDKVKLSAAEIINKIDNDVADYRLALADYRDFNLPPYGGETDYPYRAVLPFTKDKNSVVEAINGLTLGWGDDNSESVYTALMNAMDTVELGAWRAGVDKVIMLIGDAPPHDPEPISDYTFDKVVEKALTTGLQYASTGLKPGDMLAAAGANTYTDAVTGNPIKIYSIVVGTDPSTYDVYSRLSEATGAEAFIAAGPDDLVGVVTGALNQIVVEHINRAPVCNAAVASVPEVWPPNHKMRDITVMNVIDPDGDPVTIKITGITQDEAVTVEGSGQTSPDAEFENDLARIRAERTGKEDGRVYEISFTADDGRGKSCSGSVLACVPHSQGSNIKCADGGQMYDATLYDPFVEEVPAGVEEDGKGTGGGSKNNDKENPGKGSK